MDRSAQPPPKAYNEGVVAQSMNGKALAWGLLFLLAGTVVAAGWVGRAWSTGPRLGAASLLLVLGAVLVIGSNAAWILRRTQADGPGGCPVGKSCACGHFNFKPRRTCRQCGAATDLA